MGKAYEYDPKHLLAYCECGFKLMETTKEDIWNGIQPQCVRCIRKKQNATKGRSRRTNSMHQLQKAKT